MSAIATLIIVAYNSVRYLPRQIEALNAQTEQRFEVIFWDNASAPEKRADPATLPPNWRHVQSPTNLGFAAANNAAAKLATTPFLVFLNPDAFPAPGWLAALLAGAERWPHAVCFGSTQWRADEAGVLDGVGDVLHATGFAYRAGYGARMTPPPTAEIFSACAAAMLVRRDAFSAVGGFDERFFCYFEDVDLGFRLRLKGGAVIQLRDAEVEHVGGGVSGAHSPFGDFHGARNRIWCFFKTMPAPFVWLLAPAHLLLTALICGLHAMGGRGLATARGAVAGLRGLGPVLKDRKAVQATRTVSLWQIARALSWSPLALARRQPVHHAITVDQPAPSPARN